MASNQKESVWLGVLRRIIQNILKRLGQRARKNTHNQHVVPTDDGWGIRGEGNQRLTATYDYQDDAIDRAREIAKNYKSSVIIHRKDGTIRDRTSYK
ncbi:MAG: hypothetical protein ACI9NN_000750 [Bacteroidia bacterium]|jgi:hypothetical protein